MTSLPSKSFRPSLGLGALLLTGVLAGLVGCGEPDEGTDAEGERPSLRSAAPPTIPWLDAGRPPIEDPQLDCPEGWREASSTHGQAVCEPWPEAGRATCGPAEIHVPGTAGCAPIGPDCPISGFASDLPASGVIYVAPGALEGADGSAERPFGTIAEAVEAATDGDTIALAIGEWDEAVQLPDGVSLRGACVEGSVITRSVCPEENLDAAVHLGGGSATVRDLSIADAECGGLQIDGGTPTVHDVAIRGNRRSGLWIRGGTVQARDLLVQGTRPRPSDGLAGIGVDVRGTGSLSLERAAILDNHDNGAWLWATGTETTLADVVIAGTEPNRDGESGVGLYVNQGHRVSARRLVIADGHGGLYSGGSNTEILVEDLVLRGHTAEPGTGLFGRCIESSDGAKTTVRRVWADACPNVGVLAVGSETTVEDAVFEDLSLSPRSDAGAAFVTVNADLELLRVASTGSEADQLIALEGGRLRASHTQITGTTRFGPGCGVEAQGGGSLTLDHVEIEGAATCGVLVGQGVVLTATDVRIAENAAFNAPALDILGSATVERLLVEDHHGAAAWIHRNGSATLTDASLREILPDEDREYGEALWIGEGARSTLTRIDIRGVGLVGALVDGGAEATVQDVRIDDVRGDGNGIGGDGVLVRTRGSLSGTNLEIHRARQAGIHVASDGEAELTGVWVAETAPMTCASSTCPETSAAVGVHVNDASLTLEDFGLVDNMTAGATANGGSLVLRDGGIAGHPLAIHGEGIQLEGDVSLADNDADEDATPPAELTSSY